jgi:hypothetical protein
MLALISRYFGYGEIKPRLVSANRVEFVPKSWKTDRTIACEAEGNMFLQLAFDRFCKSRLRRRGINLYDQTRNREMAREGSVDASANSWATVDLSMASDTLAYNTVRLLLPEEWFGYLRSIRSQYGNVYQDQRLEYAKFSSMGNGATFTLETLVFAAACYAVGSRHFSVYGDDIIIETRFAEELMAFLAFLGFIPNASKTFLQGPVRESCGTLWHEGTLITPRYIREIDGRKAVLCHLVNTMVEIGQPGGELWKYLAEFTAKNNLPFVPYNEDTMSGVHIDEHTAYERKLIVTHNRGLHAWIPRFKAFKPRSGVLRNWDSRSLFLWHFGAPGRGEFCVEVRVRGFRTKYKFFDFYESSRNSTSSYKYVWKWVYWTPVVGAPDHLYGWSEQVTCES